MASKHSVNEVSGKGLLACRLVSYRTLAPFFGQAFCSASIARRARGVRQSSLAALTFEVHLAAAQVHVTNAYTHTIEHRACEDSPHGAHAQRKQ